MIGPNGYSHLMMGDLLQHTSRLAVDFLNTLTDRPVGRPVEYDALLASMGGQLPAEGDEPCRVVDHLARVADPGLVATAGARYFGFVIGGALPASVAAEWLSAA